MQSRRESSRGGSLVGGAVIAPLLLLLAARAAAGESFDFFEAKIRPVLADRCYRCHSEAAGKLRGKLSLDTREGIRTGGGRGAAVVPGDGERSVLLRAIRYQDARLRMPPEGKLPEVQVADFEAWIASGAADPRDAAGPAPKARREIDWETARRHWAFQPPRAHPVPPVRDAAWPRTPVDAFVLARLEAEGLRPAPPADRRTLIRRATFDLTGLPPAPEEVEAFERDPAPDAYERLVERLLASPRYGERWARYWLDVARFADTKGYVYADREERRFLHSHLYRDWVIRVFNEDMPYDRFLMLQIAGDRMAVADAAAGEEAGGEAAARDLAAMGFLTLGRRFLGVLHDIIDDRIDVLMRGTQALTVGCARCHDHKFDPIPTRDYYSLYGVFQASTERTVCLETHPEETREYLAYREELRKREEALRKVFEAKRDALLDRLRAKVGEYLAAVLEVEKLPSEEFYTLKGPDDLNPVVARQWQAYLFQAGKGFHPVWAVWSALAALPAEDFAARAGAALDDLRARADVARAGAGADSLRALNPLVAGAFAGPPPASMRQAAERYAQLLLDVQSRWRQALDAAVKAGAPAPAALPDPAAEEVRRVLYGLESPINVPPGSINEMEWFFDEPSRVEMGKLQAKIDAWKIEAPGAPPHAVVLEDRASSPNPRVFRRGNPALRGEEVPRRFVEVIAGPPREGGTAPDRKPFTQGSGRLELAQAIASRDNPLTARVMVNRVWLHHFGAGLVRTPSDFGTRSEPPSHPQLLDWLALRFMDGGWSLKALHRLILLSSAYRQSSSPAPGDDAAFRVDPENRLLSRMSRRRLDLEALHDSLLAVSGELDLTMGGRGADLLSPPFRPRRMVYGLVDRQFLPGILRVFDFANPDQHSPQRHSTTVPQQALFLLNSPFAAGRARALAHRADVQARSDPAERIQRLYGVVYGRRATPEQVADGRRFIEESRSAPPERPAAPAVWLYGWGRWDEAMRRVAGFQPLPHFSGEAWQGGPSWPDPALGWVQLTAKGGHAGNDLDHAAVRRWTAPADGKASISGKVAHAHPEGDGIRARIVSSRSGLLALWLLHDQSAAAAVEPVEVKAGDTIDFVVDRRDELGWDDFSWAPVIKMGEREWKAEADFAGPEPAALDEWEQYAQVLLLSNEFLFVD